MCDHPAFALGIVAFKQKKLPHDLQPRRKAELRAVCKHCGAYYVFGTLQFADSELVHPGTGTASPATG